MHRARRSTLPALVMLLVSVAAGAEPAARVWHGADGRPLPFGRVDQLLEFLAGADVVEVIDLSVGVTKPQQLVLEHDGVRAHAVFHSIDRRERQTKTLVNGRVMLYLVDSYRSQIAAFELSRLLGLDIVPPTVERQVRGRVGSVQLWIESAMTEQKRRERGLEPPDRSDWNHQKSEQWVFDNLINNIDRNQGNSLIDADWNLWLIDHSRSFGRDRRLPYPERVSFLSSGLWQGLRALDPDTVRERLSPYLDKAEIRALLERRDLLVAAIEGRIARLGQARVIRERGEAWMSMSVSETPGR